MEDTISRNKNILNLLDTKKFFKIEFNNDFDNSEDIENLTYLYTLSGCKAFDVDSNFENINLVKKNIDLAILNSRKFGIYLNIKPAIIFSFSKDDFRKERLDFQKNLNFVLKEGIDIFEFDLNEFYLEEALEILKKVKSYSFNQLFSLSISRGKLSNASILEIIKYAKEISKKIIIEVDGINLNMNDEFELNETLQVLSTADIINKQLKFKEVSFRRLPIILKGGTNISTRDFAHQCGVDFNGITFGKYVLKNTPKEILNNVKKIEGNLIQHINHIEKFINDSLP